MYGRRERLVPSVNALVGQCRFLCPEWNMYGTDSHLVKETSAAHRCAVLDTSFSVPLFLKKYKLVLKSTLTKVFFCLVSTIHMTIFIFLFLKNFILYYCLPRADLGGKWCQGKVLMM